MRRRRTRRSPAKASLRLRSGMTPLRHTWAITPTPFRTATFRSRRSRRLGMYQGWAFTGRMTWRET
jgi:hypothetical protein